MGGSKLPPWFEALRNGARKALGVEEVPLSSPKEVTQRGIRDGYIDEEALGAINLEVKVTF